PYSFELIRAKTGHEVIEFLESNPDIALILMDIKMPELDGYEASKIIRKKYQKIPIIAQTSFALKSEQDKYADVFDEYLTKPLSSDKLDAIIRKYL
ncbi:response regulator, partial [Bacteroidota bacterium]